MYIVNNMLCVYLEYFNIIKNKIKNKVKKLMCKFYRIKYNYE